jgi:hypothetical protein
VLPEVPEEVSSSLSSSSDQEREKDSFTEKKVSFYTLPAFELRQPADGFKTQ